MALTHGAATRNAMCNVVVNRIDLGAAAGTLKFLTSLDVVLCTITCADPAFDSAFGGTANMLGLPKQSTGAVAGTVAKFLFADSDGVTIFEGSVGTSGQDINLSSVTLATNDIIQIDALSYSAAS
jgi:hypothetical protein